MSPSSPLNVSSEKMKKALQWLSNSLLEHPEKTRASVLEEAELRFDLTPAECNFLHKNFLEPHQ